MSSTVGHHLALRQYWWNWLSLNRHRWCSASRYLQGAHNAIERPGWRLVQSPARLCRVQLQQHLLQKWCPTSRGG